MVGKDAYAHPHTHKMDAQPATHTKAEAVAGSEQRSRSLGVLVRDMKAGAKAVGHTMTHLPQAASEVAGRMMGKDNYEHPRSPSRTRSASPMAAGQHGRHGRSNSSGTVHQSTQRSSFEVINPSSSAPEVDVVLAGDLEPPAKVDRSPHEP
ncbi:MAG: hypothetical protein WDW38_008682 [Sanguina aurantia]